jgi:hypothetical protein
MQKENMIAANEFCSSHDLDISFVYSLQQFGLIEVSVIEETICFPLEQLPQAERIARLHSELGINLEGIDAISHLLKRVEELQNEIHSLKGKLSLYEDLH